MNCPTCEVSSYRVLGNRGGEFHRYGLGVPSRIVRCTRCDLIYPDPFPYPLDPQELYGDPDKYFERHDRAVKVEAGRTVVRGIVERTGIARPSILDVGSGRGELLHSAVLEGLTDVVGLEFSDAMIEYAQQRYGVVVLKESVEEHARSTARSYDAVVLNAVLEHVYDPDSMIAAVARLMHPGSVVYLDLPLEPNLLTRVRSLVNHVTGSRSVLNLSPTFSPFHVFGFNGCALGTLLAKHGLVVESCQIWAEPKIPAGLARKDQMRALIGTQVNRLANLTGTASNMCAWAKPLESPRLPGGGS